LKGRVRVRVRVRVAVRVRVGQGWGTPTRAHPFAVSWYLWLGGKLQE
jgi:hypothetical protein